MACIKRNSLSHADCTFQEAIRATASKRAPWYVVPADNKWATRLAVAGAIVEAIDGLDLELASWMVMSETEHREYQIGEQVSSTCGAAFEFGPEGRAVLKKDDARCRY
jgi:hypothetical protein